MDDELITFLLARLTDDELAARDAAHGPWHVEGGYPQRISNAAAVLVAECYTTPEAPPWEAEHITRHDPARVLREVEAKRAIMALLAETEACLNRGYTDIERGAQLVLLRACQCVAAVYSDHPDYKQEWAP